MCTERKKDNFINLFTFTKHWARKRSY